MKNFVKEFWGRIFLLLCIVLLSNCRGDKVLIDPINSNIEDIGMSVSADLLTLKPNEGLIYLKDKAFTGDALKMEKAKVVGLTQYVKGKKNGLTQKWYANDTLSYQSKYENGKLHGAVYSYWKDGKLRSHSQFQNGIANGTQKQWYQSGALFKEVNLVDGRESGIQRAWRENGKIYNNYEAKNGRIFGLKRSTLCYELNEEEVQYAN